MTIVTRTLSVDLATSAGRAGLVLWALREAPRLDVLVNNAGVQRRVDLARGYDALSSGDDEVEINFVATIEITARLLPELLTRPSAIVNISSGLAFVPLADAPIYSATKAALHSYTQSLRHQLRGTSVGVFEVMPPAVATDLDKGARTARGERRRAIGPDLVADAVLRGMQRERAEIAIGSARVLRVGGRWAPRLFFRVVNGSAE